MKIEEKNEDQQVVEEENSVVEQKEIEGYPKFIKTDGDAFYVTLKSGKVIKMEDIPAKKMLRAEKLATTKDGDINSSKYQLNMISEMTGIGELDLQEYKSSDFNRLKNAMMRIMDFEDFL